MCGRFEIHSPLEIIAKVFDLSAFDRAVAPNYNVAPGQDIPVVLSEGGQNRLVVCRWGFLPHWAKDRKDGYRMINARAETVAEKPAFRAAFKDHRCLVVADGFYEWTKEGARKQPVYVRLRSGRPFGFAGLYSDWTSPEGERVRTATILTTNANELLRPVHDRMPVIAQPDAYRLWLDPAVQDTARLEAVLRPYPPDALELYPVTPGVNSPKNNTPENIRPLDAGR